MRIRTTSFVPMAAIAALIVTGSGWSSSHAQSMAIADVSHIHGIAVNLSNTSQLYLATHDGVFLTSPDGTATPVSSNKDDYMSFTSHPSDASTFFASGHPKTGGNSGFLVSRDAARSWEQVSPGVNGPVDFHAMTVSAADPNVLYGLYGEIQTSTDGGKTWQVVGAPPADIYGLAASVTDPQTIYAATGQGVMVSRDGAKTWEPSGPAGQPASFVNAAPDGAVYAFVVGSGLVKLAKSAGEWEPITDRFGNRVLIHFAADPSNSDNLFAVTQHSEVIVSADGGKSWKPLG
ncbi:F510_1955 family glycosylhydrolase [Aurantimonas marianensis]|uniref:Exo-alpha-sialidase n=1 Tax=Aurantimonas marianensis TaxID=2920428 RepID=A0A9X2KFN9_9HYPH|nr:hypothetical protein [Aurantimonas marianensis]MCP3055989.1 hypothetical protein [Aurantimonas marianensis]